MSKSSIYKLTTSAILVALSTVLSLVKVWQMPLGGAITLLSMVPVCMISVLYGTRYAILPCFLYGAIQMFLDNPFGWGLTPTILIGSIFFDYLFAFGILCLAGVFRKYGDWGVIGGVALACFARFVSHFISGYVLFANLEQWDVFGKVFVNRPALYSICYNGLYMLPELVITVIGIFILCKTGAVNQIKKMTERK